MAAGRGLRVEALEPATVVWTCDAWVTWRETPTADPGLDVHVADLPTPPLAAGTVVEFTLKFAGGRWNGPKVMVRVA